MLSIYSRYIALLVLVGMKIHSLHMQPRLGWAVYTVDCGLLPQPLTRLHNNCCPQTVNCNPIQPVDVFQNMYNACLYIYRGLGLPFRVVLSLLCMRGKK